MSDRKEINEAIRSAVRNYGGNKDVEKFLQEVAQVESSYGSDLSNPQSMGPWQIDRIRFDDINSRPKYKGMFEEAGIEQWEDIGKDVGKAAAATRIILRAIPEPIPDNLSGRAAYWKRYWNTPKGKGKMEHYIQKNISPGRGRDIGVEVQKAKHTLRLGDDMPYSGSTE